MRTLNFLTLVTVVLSSGCLHIPEGSAQHPVWEETQIAGRLWHPASAEFVRPRNYVYRAIQYFGADEDAVRAANPVFLGHLVFKTAHARFVARAGGTHFRIADTLSTAHVRAEQVDCAAWSSGNFGVGSCSRTPAYTYSTEELVLEVWRVSPENLTRLPPYLRPREDDYL
jgi:hypothetical protein